MALSDAMIDDFVVSARVAGDLIGDDAVARDWTRESACEGMSVGGLAWHLAGQWHHAIGLTAAEPGPDEAIPLLDHYRQAAWVSSATDDEANVEIRESADEQAEAGHAALSERVRAELEALPGALAAAATREPDRVLIPWQGWSLTTHDFLVTRLMEMVVHSDDLAASVGLPTPEFPDGAVREVLGLLTGVAVRRHGQVAVVRALSRPQRATGHVSAF